MSAVFPAGLAALRWSFVEPFAIASVLSAALAVVSAVLAASLTVSAVIPAGLAALEQSYAELFAFASVLSELQFAEPLLFGQRLWESELSLLSE